MNRLYKVILKPSKIKFSVQENQTILDSALSNGITLEYSCSNGRCGQCKAKLLSGKVSLNNSSQDVILLEHEILTCCSTPITNIELLAHHYPQLNHIKRKTIPAKIYSIEYLNDRILNLILRLPPKAEFQFLSGQYLDLVHDGEKRSYSIASPKVSQNLLELQIKKVDDGLFSKWLFNNIEIDQLVRFYGPLGTFFLREGSSSIIFLCTGTGFAPIKSMVESLIESGSKRIIHILWGGQTLADLYSKLPFQWSNKYNNITFTPVISQENAKLENVFLGYVQDAVVALIKGLSKYEVYACGSEQMIDQARDKLIKAGLNSDKFYSDAFLASNLKR